MYGQLSLTWGLCGVNTDLLTLTVVLVKVLLWLCSEPFKCSKLLWLSSNRQARIKKGTLNHHCTNIPHNYADTKLWTHSNGLPRFQVLTVPWQYVFSTFLSAWASVAVHHRLPFCLRGGCLCLSVSDFLFRHVGARMRHHLNGVLQEEKFIKFSSTLCY